jgi:hypothetical protein
MSLPDIVQVVVSRETAAPSQQGFSLPMILAYHTFWPERQRTYTATADMLTDGFPENHEAVRAAKSLLAQNPKLSQFLVGREENRQAQKINIAPVASNLKASYEYTVTVNDITFSYTSDASPTAAEIVDGLKAALVPAAWAPTTAYTVGEYRKNDTTPVKVYRCTDGGTSAGSGGPTGTGSGIVDGGCTWDYVCAEQNTGVTDNGDDFDLFADSAADAFSIVIDKAVLHQENITPDGTPDGVVADIVAIQEENDDWYALAPTNLGKAPIIAIEAYLEGLVKIGVSSSGDDAIYDPTSDDDIAAASQAAAYSRFMLMYHHKPLKQMPHAALLGRILPYDPGTITAKFKTLGNVDYTVLNQGLQNAIRAKNCNMYVRISGINMAQEGNMSSGEWLDVMMGIDFLTARLQENIFTRLVNLKKIPFTDIGVSIIENEVRGVMELGITKEILAADPAPIITVPLVADVSSIDKANRHLPDVTAEAVLAGAIHSVRVLFRVTV